MYNCNQLTQYCCQAILLQLLTLSWTVKTHAQLRFVPVRTLLGLVRHR